MGKQNHFFFQKESGQTINDSMDILFDHFLDKYPKMAKENDKGWLFELEPPSQKEWFVDEKLSEQLKVHFKLDLKNVAQNFTYRNINGVHVVISMFHSYALYAVANFLHSNQDINGLEIVHFDDHTDLMFCLVPINTFYEMPVLDLSIPESVISSIDSGLVGMGNFLSSYLIYSNLTNNIVHIKNSDSLCGVNSSKLGKQEKTVNLGGNNFKKITLESSLNAFTGTESEYKRIKYEPGMAIHLGEKNIWLDIDLDFFNNRYNKDSDWEYIGYHDPPMKSVKKLMEDVRNLIILSDWIDKVSVFTLAYSPGFFPAEYYLMAKEIIEQPLLTYFENKKKGDITIE